jgi:hypothetical protein
LKGKPYRRRTLIMADLLTKQATFLRRSTVLSIALSYYSMD